MAKEEQLVLAYGISFGLDLLIIFVLLIFIGIDLKKGGDRK